MAKTTKKTTRRARTRTRVERDSMGEMTVPAHVLYGATTQRAVLNFPVSGRPVPIEVIGAFAELKRACAQSNGELGIVRKPVARAIVASCDRLLDGLQADEVPLHLAKQRHTLRRETQAPLPSVEQTQGEPNFQVRQQPAHCGL